MRTRKHIVITVILCITMILTMAACGGGSGSGGSDNNAGAGDNAAQGSATAPNADAVKIRIANQVAEDHPQTQALYYFEEILEERSEGRYDVEVYPNNTLGAAEVYNDSLITGTIEMAMPGTIMAQSYPLDATLECPLLFRDWDHVKKALLESDVLDEMFADMPEKVGTRWLGTLPQGFRVVSSSKSIESLDDFNGLKLRVPNIPVYIEMAKALNANVISMNMSELFTALEQKAVDAQENPYVTIYTSKYFEVQDYIVETNHIFTAHGWYVNENFWQSLSGEDQALVQECVDEAILKCFELQIDGERDAKEKLENEHGLTIIVPQGEFKESMEEAIRTSRATFYEMYPGSEEFIQKIEAL